MEAKKAHMEESKRTRPQDTVMPRKGRRRPNSALKKNHVLIDLSVHTDEHHGWDVTPEVADGPGPTVWKVKSIHGVY